MSPFTPRNPDSELMSGWVRKQLRQKTCSMPQDPVPHHWGPQDHAMSVLQAGASGTGRGNRETQGMTDGGLNAT